MAGKVRASEPAPEETTSLRRRTFLATLPLATAGTVAVAKSNNEAAQQQVPSEGQYPPLVKGVPPHEDGELPKFQREGAEWFVRPDVHAGDRISGASFASRSAAMGCSGAAGTAHPIATLTAIEILKKGGSAADAAVAANACLGFMEPTSSGLGGDCYAMVWDPKLKKVVGLAGSGRSPQGLTLETVRSRAKNGAIPAHGAVAVSVPGALSAWWALHQRYGKLKWAELLEPAIHYAETGVPEPQVIGYYIKRNMAAFMRPGAGIEETANAAHTYMPGGKAPGEGDVFRNPDLAHTYKVIAQGGWDVFYNGEIAQTIAA